MHMMEILLVEKWVCARDGPWRFPGKRLSWIQAGRCGWVPGWKFLDGPRRGNLDRTVVGNGMERSSGHEMEVSLGIFNPTQARRKRRMCGWRHEWAPARLCNPGCCLEILKLTLTWKSGQASAWKLERKGTQGMRWRFPWKLSVGPELGEVEG